MNDDIILKGRFISDKRFIDSINNGDLDYLFKYLENNKEKYNLTIRDNKMTLYSYGRGINIRKNVDNYVISFNLNTASLYSEEELNKLIEFINKYNFDTSKYNEWKIDKKKNNILSAKIYDNEIKKYDFKTILDELCKVFESYKDARKEETFKQEFTYVYDNDRNDYIVFDTEYEHSFDVQSDKDNVGKTMKADLVALKKCNDKYRVVFIELKENVNASVSGNSSNIGDHIIDTLNFSELYNSNLKEKERFIKYVKFNLEFKVKHNLLDIKDIKNILDNIDFSESPDIIIVCGFNTETKEDLRSRLLSKFKRENKYKNYKEWKNTIIVGPCNTKILLEKGMPLNKFLEEKHE